MPPKREIDGNRLTELYRTGMSGNAIARELGCSPSFVLSQLEKLGIHKKKSRGRIDHDEPHTHDTPEQIQRCLNCRSPHCVGSGRGCYLWGAKT